MNVAEKTKCAHPNCSCEVSENQKYCSTACEEAHTGAGSTKHTSGQGECGCNHSQCRMAA